MRNRRTRLRLLGAALALVTVAALVFVWHNRDRHHLCAPMMVALPAIVLISPHAMFYDAGLLVLPLAALLATRHVQVREAVIVLWCAGLLDAAKQIIGLTPIFAVTIVVFLLALFNTRRYENLPKGVAA